MLLNASSTQVLKQIRQGYLGHLCPDAQVLVTLSSVHACALKTVTIW